jgi:hypothetical protein
VPRYWYLLRQTCRDNSLSISASLIPTMYHTSRTGVEPRFSGSLQRSANWARLIKKVYEVDPLECPQCDAALRSIALMDDPAAGACRRTVWLFVESRDGDGATLLDPYWLRSLFPPSAARCLG